MLIPFSPPDISEKEISAVTRVLSSGWITTGPVTKQFESQICAYLKTSKTVCLNSATSCEEMILRFLGIGPGDEVIVPVYTYTATASPVCHVGAKLVFVDCGKDSFELDYDAVEEAITPHTKAIIPVDVGGIPCDYDRLMAIVERKKDLFSSVNPFLKKLGRIAVIADSAHAFGAEYHGKKCGAVADFTSFSFHAVKNLTTGEGGALTWRRIEGVSDDEIYNRLMLLSLHGQSKDAFSKMELGSWEYDIVSPDYKCNMTDITAALGVAQLERYPALSKRREEIVLRYNEKLVPAGIWTAPHFQEGRVSSKHLYFTRVPGISVNERNDIIVRMAEKGVAANVHYKPLAMMTAYKNLGFDIRNFPNAYAMYQNEITLPLHTRLSDEEVDYVAETYLSCLK